MAVEWSTSAPDLLVSLDRAAPTSLRTQLEGRLRDAVRTGRLAPGERLPSSRALAQHLAISRGLVQECFEQLVAEGYLVSRAGSGTRVADLAAEQAPSRPPSPNSRQSSAAAPTPPTPAETSALVADFQSGVPDLGLAPREDWAWAMREACRTAPNTAFDYGDPRGDPHLRDVLAAYLRRVRAADAHSSQILVCAGFQQGLALVLRSLALQGRTRIAVEDPGSIGTITALAHTAGGDCVPVGVDDDGLDVAALEASGAQVVVVTPAHQWPTGVVLSADRRHELVAWARARDGMIIEDDYDAEFRYDREPVGSLQGLAPERVVSLGTVSKSLAPTLRLGWAVLPTRLIEPVGAAKQTADRGAPGLDQLALAGLLESGRYDRHLRRMRAVYSRRRDTLVAALAEHAPQVALTGLAAGFHAIVHLPAGADEDIVVTRARRVGVGLYGISAYRSAPQPGRPQLVLGFGNTADRAIEEGIRIVAPVLR
ncbi:PLP-dependent aminotransferase family protein [Marmoricola sp. URHB0036]|uniref:MocR-like pyridoxine biosynthesis transcription factor PdxR n=1 Tax=Marmoricola sp. URHB0036 TaxID=1298863 RepID=UPI00041345E3|nr:PLP-dependent aminotransferase family protein [Marmoricola sp. URHB0036]